jgi:hypothetical protein
MRIPTKLDLLHLVTTSSPKPSEISPSTARRDNSHQSNSAHRRDQLSASAIALQDMCRRLYT